jgi:hypothetical protein
MSTTVVEAASRHAHRPGFNLVAFREVGLPIYRQTLLAVVMVNKELPALQEFALRAVDAGFETPAAIAAFLGLEERDLDEALFGLVSERFLELHAGRNGADPLVLTQRGRQALEEFRMTQAEERTYVVDYDGLLRRPTSYRGWAIREKALREVGAIPIAPAPPRKPAVSELDIGQVEAVLRESKNLDKTRKLLELVRVARTETLFVRATMLVFRAQVGDEVQAAFVIDGRLSEEHGLAFAESDGPARLGLLQMSDSPLRTAAAEVLGRKAAETAFALLEEASALPPDGEEPASVVDAPQPTYELLETYDHPRYLEQALSSKRRLIIVSPWIKRRVVNDAFVGQLRELLRRGTDVYVGFGLGSESEGSDDRDAIRALQRLADEQPNLMFRRLGDSHAKVLISDNAYAIITSFNWLSFIGDPARTFRDERGMLVRRADVVDAAATSLLSRFMTAQRPERV